MHCEDRNLIGGLNIFACDPRVGMFEYEYRYQKVNTRVHEFNTASIALHEKLGFVREGRVRRAVYTGGRYWDLLLFGLTVEEFRAREAP